MTIVHSLCITCWLGIESLNDHCFESRLSVSMPGGLIYCHMFIVLDESNFFCPFQEAMMSAWNWTPHEYS